MKLEFNIDKIPICWYCNKNKCFINWRDIIYHLKLSKLPCCIDCLHIKDKDIGIDDKIEAFQTIELFKDSNYRYRPS